MKNEVEKISEVETDDEKGEKCTSPSTNSKHSGSQAADPQQHESWLTNSRIYFRHPLARIWIACQIGVFDFLLYGEDPVNDSHVECNLPGVGHVVHFVLRWPSSPGFIVLRLFLVLATLLAGLWIGRQWFHHRLLRDRWKLEMFEGDKGTFLAMGICTIISLFIGAMVYNILLPTDQPPVSGALGIETRTFGKITQCFSWNADLFSILMITDAVLQDRHHWGDWAPGFKKYYCEAHGGYVRVVVMAVAFIIASVFPMIAIFSTGKEEDSIRWNDRNLGGFSEVTRTLFASCIIFSDLFTVVQDWDFPSFEPPLEAEFPVYILFTFKTQLNWKWCSCFERFVDSLREGCVKRILLSPDFFHVVITGPWLTYGPLLCVMFVDLLCMKNQAFYTPNQYGQYVDPETNRIWSIVDTEYLALAYDEGVLKDPKLVTWEARRGRPEGPDASTLTDIELNARYLNAPWSALGGLPGVCMIIVFTVLVRFANSNRLVSHQWARSALSSIGLGSIVQTSGSKADSRVTPLDPEAATAPPEAANPEAEPPPEAAKSPGEAANSPAELPPDASKPPGEAANSPAEPPPNAAEPPGEAANSPAEAASSLREAANSHVEAANSPVEAINLPQEAVNIPPENN